MKYNLIYMSLTFILRTMAEEYLFPRMLWFTWFTKLEPNNMKWVCKLAILTRTTKRFRSGQFCWNNCYHTNINPPFILSLIHQLVGIEIPAHELKNRQSFAQNQWILCLALFNWPFPFQLLKILKKLEALDITLEILSVRDECIFII